MAVLARDAVPNVALYNLRDGAGLSQHEVCEELNRLAREKGKHWSCNPQSVSRWERGVVARPDPLARRLLAELFGVSIEELGFTRQRPDAAPGAGRDGDFVLSDLAEVPHGIDPRVERSQMSWLSARQDLNERRATLSQLAARLYEPANRLAGTGLLVRPEWMAPAPVDLSGIALDLRTADAPVVAGGEPQAAASLPLATVATRYHRYSQALRQLGAVRLFENRLSYRLLDVDWAAASQMTFGHTTYFEMADVCELTAHEMAVAHPEPATQPSWRRLPFRRVIGDPFDLSRRPVLPSINTLTIRRSAAGSPSMVLHRRDAGSVAVAGQMLHIMPAGVFQPASVGLPTSQTADFDLWRNVMREYSEEFLGNPEHDGDGGPIDYAKAEPFMSLDRARRSGQLRIYCFGVALDALTLYGEILTVAVIDAEVYDEIFADMVSTNMEGTVAAAAVPFEEHTVRKLLAGDGGYALAPAAAGCIKLAWQHRSIVLGE